MPKYKVYATQKMKFNELIIEADTPEEAELVYDHKWNLGGEVYSVDYDEDSVEFTVEAIPEKS